MLPGGLEAFFEEGGDPATERTLPPPKEPDFPRIIAIAAKYQLEILGPPPAEA